MRHLFTMLVLGLTAFTSFAQNTGKIAGTILDESGKPVASATASLLNQENSSLVKVAITDKEGKYEFLNIKEGKYVLSASYVGYEKSNSQPFEVSADKTAEVPAIAMRPASKDLAAVVVEGKKPFVETKLDRTIVNVEASPSSAGASAMDILEKSPGVMVNNDGVISLRGKQGVIVMMDGKPTYLSATDLANFLKNTPASALDVIEIMTNPSAKYDASGNSGIINIKTKKSKNDGFNGSLTLGATTSIYELDDEYHFMPKSQNSFNFNYKKSKVNLFGNYNPNMFRGRNTMEFESKQIDGKTGEHLGYTDQVTKFKFGNENHTLKLGLDYYANKRNIFGIVASGFAFNGHPTPTTIGDDKDLNGNLRSRLISQANNDVKFKNFTGNANWKHNFKKAGQELTADIDYVRYSNVTEMSLVTDEYDGNLVFKRQSQLRGHIPADIHIKSFRTDYTQPLKNGRIDAGVKTSLVTNDNLVNYDFYNGSSWVHDNIRSNHFIYEENINAAYVTMNRQIKKWTVQAGVRVENTIGSGSQIITKTEIKRDTTNFFPTAFVSYAADKKNIFTLSMGKRILRPNYQDLNPFIFFLDTLSYRKGNPDLKPQYTTNLELSHSFKGKFITTIAYNNTTDVISQIIKPDTASNGKIRFLTPDNVAKLRNMSLSVTAPIAFAKWWNANLFTNVWNNHYSGIYDTLEIDQQFTSFSVNMTNSFTIKPGFTAEISGFYRHNTLEQLTRAEPMYHMGFAVQKTILKGKGTVRVNARDPFAWQRFSGYNKYGYVDMQFRNRPDTRQLTGTFTYRFGKTANAQRKRTLSSQEEQNRVGGAQ